MRRSFTVAALLLAIGTACVNTTDNPQTAPGNEPFRGPLEKVTRPASGEPLNLPRAGTYRYTSTYSETGQDHKHDETLEVSSPVVVGRSTEVTSWWRQDTEMPSFEITFSDEGTTRTRSFSMTEARVDFCSLDPPMLTLPSPIGVGSGWNASSVCKNDTGFKRYLTSEMKIVRSEPVTVEGETIPALVIEGQLRIIQRNTMFTLGVERYLSPTSGLILKETLRFADTRRGNGKIDRTLVSASGS